MGKEPLTDRPDLLRRSLLIGGAAAAAMPNVVRAQGGNSIRIGVPTKTYWPTIIAETAIRQKLFDKEGIKAELTIYRSGAEGFEAIAAGAADLILNSSSSVAAGLNKGVNVRCIANGANGYYGWYLVVKPDSKIQKISELEGLKVGITSAGSGSDILARWTIADRKVNFTRVPLGGGGLVPNLIKGNIDATVLYAIGEQKEQLTQSDLRVDSPYNTRRYTGLPPTPIASPGRASLEAALHPADGPWIYYVIEDEQGHHFFTESASEFEAARQRAQAAGLL